MGTRSWNIDIGMTLAFQVSNKVYEAQQAHVLGKLTNMASEVGFARTVSGA